MGKAHTPGPWKVFERRHEITIGPSCNCTVAGCYSTAVGDLSANAKLLAASPELLETLEDTLNGLLAAFPHADRIRDILYPKILRARDLIDRLS